MRYTTHECTIEEREEYEPHLDNGVIVYAGVDYEAILRQAEQEVDIVLWDGGNNDFSFYKSDLSIVVADPHRAGNEKSYHPGETNVRAADVFVINKVDTADPEKVITVRNNLHDGSRRRFQHLMDKLGVDDALRKAGVQEGDSVFVGEYELEWQE